jgi:hypothetical protein
MTERANISGQDQSTSASTSPLSGSSSTNAGGTEFDQLLRSLERLTPSDYGYVALTALIGPLALRLLGFRFLAPLVRPIALLILLGGAYAQQQKLGARANDIRRSIQRS